MARLPQPGGDKGAWGTILNDYLSQAHNTDGSLKDDIVTSDKIAPNAVDESVLGATGGSDGQVLTKDISTTTGLSWKTVSGSGTTPDASNSVKGVVQLTGDLGGTAASPTVPSLTTKANDASVVHLSGSETITGVKTYSASPVVPTPTTGTQAANKTYVDSVSSPDATSSVKGVVQLAGDLGGTAAAPTVIGLSSKASDATVIHLAGAETVTGIKTFSASPVVPTPSIGTQAANKTYVDSVSSPDATGSVKGVVQLTGDFGGTAAAPTVPGLTAKANDASVVHLSGAETVTGVKTYSASPIVPTPTTGTQAANKTYVDSVASSGSPDATSSVKGIVQLTGDLGGTAASPTVPGLANKANDSATVHNTGTETVAGVKTFSSSPIVPTPTTGTQATNKTYVDGVVAAGAPDATTSSKGIVQLAGDLGGTATSPTVPGLTAKAADSAVVHNSGAETVAGVKTFSSSPIVPTPTTSTQAANKSYVDSAASAPDATSSVKGIVQLTGDLGGTAASPTVPGLAGKANTSHSHAIADVTSLQATLDAKASETITFTGANSLSGGGDLSTNRTLSLLNDSASPGVDKYYGTNAGGTKGWYTIAGGGASGQFGHIFLDDQAGATDDDKLTAAISAQQSTAGMPPIVLGARNHSFNVTRTLYSGLKLIGQSTGPKNLEQDPDFVTSRITLGAALSSGTASWWVTPGGNLFDIYMADFAVQGSAGSSKHQFIDVTTGSLYACEFHSLSFNFMRSVFGRKDRKCLVTQVVFSGHWTANNLWDTQFMLGGADCQLWVGGYINIGPSSSPAQTGTYADNDYQMLFDSLSKTDIGYIFTSSLNGWRGIKVTGSAGHGLRFFGGTYEGYKSSNDNLAAPGTVIRLEGGSGAFFGPSIGQAMQSPDAAEGGPVHMTGGEWAFYSPNFYRSPMAETEPCIYHTGGRLLVQGATRHEGEAWTNRPRYYTSSSGPNSTETSFYCPDMSMISV